MPATRRDLLRACLAGALNAHAEPPAKSRVVTARDPLIGAPRPDSGRILKTLDRAMQSLDNVDNPLEAWKNVARPGETVGLKVNCIAGRGSSSSPVLCDAICERLRQSGIRDIVIWDRSNRELESAGFHPGTRKDGVRCIGNDDAGYEPELAIFGNAASRLAQTLTRSCDAIINVPILKDHGIVGVTLALKNFFGAIHNPNKYHANAGDPYIADVFMLPAIRRKVRLTIADALTVQYEGGPSYMPQWSWAYNGLMLSRDPVALDYTGWQILDRRRAEKGMKRLADAGRAPTYIARAADAQHRIGTNDPRLIELRET